MPPHLRSILRAALAYFAGIFVLGFVLGTIRALWLAPRIGALGAVAAELPIMLAASWCLARRLTRPPVFARAEPRAVMGIVAFALLMTAEFALGVAVFGQSPGQWLAALVGPAGALGLSGQAAFAAMPLFARRARAGA